MGANITQEEIISILSKIFLADLVNHQERIRNEKKRFVHYTTAESALNILKSEEIWLRNATLMNDYMEVSHGIDCLIESYKDEAGKKFKAAINKVFPAIIVDIERDFNERLSKLKTSSFIFCISEHENEEDVFGRLSMWRAYGGSAGVALVLNSDAFLQENDDIKAYGVKTIYSNVATFKKYLNDMADKILEYESVLKKLDRSDVVLSTVWSFMLTALSSKHIGFKEEQEWRVIYNPDIERSEYVEPKIKVINGIPQEVHIIKLKNIPAINLKYVDAESLINKVIIGPSNGSYSIYKAFVKTLKDLGVSNPEQRVSVSDIPLRD